MRVNVKMYLEKNLGDDLFLYILTKRYPHISFYIHSYYQYKKGVFPSNLHMISGTFTRIYNSACNRVRKYSWNINNLLTKKSDYTVVIGGSLFIEGPYWKEVKKDVYDPLKNNFSIIGSNFGPYSSDEFYHQYFSFFDRCDDICFRDSKSVSLFKELKNVRLAPDILFTLKDIDQYQKEEKGVIFSIIDCDYKMGEKYKEEYENKICEMITFYQQKNYPITLMSFCEREGDLRAVESIYHQLKNKNDVSIYSYNGNIQEALSILGSSEIIIGSRFHSNILGMLLGKKVIPLIYSDKMINVLQDMNFKGKSINIHEIKKFKVEDLELKDYQYFQDIHYQKMEAEKQFQYLDKKLGEVYESKKTIS